MSATASSLLRTPLHAAHLRRGGRMVDFAGWEMPVQYAGGGIIAEHTAVREGCGIFDLSHMGRVYVRGRDALALSQWCTTRDLSKVPIGEAAYGLLCNPDGGIRDDVIAYVLAADTVLFVFNASNRDADREWFEEQARFRGFETTLDDRTKATALIGVQGPRAQEVLQTLTQGADLDALAGYASVLAEVAGARALVARTGYTGEDGFEVMVLAEAAETVWEALLGRAGVQACGLGARDTLRTEAGMPLYGHEIDLSTNPYEARLGWVVNVGKPEFVGRERLLAIKAEGPSRRLVGLHVGEGGVPRPGYPLLAEGQKVGELTSGTFSPTLKRTIALGYVPVDLATEGQRVDVEVRGRAVPASVVPTPFVPHRTRPRAKRATA